MISVVEFEWDEAKDRRIIGARPASKREEALYLSRMGDFR